MRQWKPMMILLFFGLSACNKQDYCDDLAAQASRPETKKLLVDWVGENIINYDLDKNELELGGGMVPGLYKVNRPFDWGSLGFSERSQIRLVGNPKRPSSVFFGERSGFGFLIRPPWAENYEVNLNFTKEIEGGFAIYCHPRD